MGFQIAQIQRHIQAQLRQQGIDGITQTVEQQGQLLLKQGPLPHQDRHQQQQNTQQRPNGHGFNQHHSQSARQVTPGQTFQPQHQGMQNIGHHGGDHKGRQHRCQQPDQQDSGQGHAQPSGQTGHQKREGCLQVGLVISSGLSKSVRVNP